MVNIKSRKLKARTGQCPVRIYLTTKGNIFIMKDMLDLLFTTPNVSVIFLIFIYLLALMFAMTVHEYSHAVVALQEGDATATVMGRKTLNPLKHIDILGIIVLLVFGFGWAKPVPVDARNFKNGSKSEARVAFAGIKTNFILGVVFLFLTQLFSVIYEVSASTSVAFLYFIILLQVFAQFNIAFGVFNLLPLYPLDGYRLLASRLGEHHSFMRFLQKYSMIIMLVLLITGALYYVIGFINSGIVLSFTNFFDYVLRGICIS